VRVHSWFQVLFHLVLNLCSAEHWGEKSPCPHYHASA
jgi:hypothetical protein